MSQEAAAPTAPMAMKEVIMGPTDSAALPSGWYTQVSTTTGQTYYVNEHTNETQYDRPTEPAVPASLEVEEPSFDPMAAAPTSTADLSSAHEPVEQNPTTSTLGETDTEDD